MKPRNIVILCPDEMKASVLGLHGNSPSVTPFLDEWGTASVVFDQCHTVHPKCTPSRCAFTSGQYPHTGGHRTLYLPLRRDEPNMIRSLREQGFHTVLAGKNHTVDAETLPLTFDTVLPRRGEATMFPTSDRFPEGTYWVGRDPVGLDRFNDRFVTRDAMEWMENKRPADRPFCLWVNWNAPHPPYGIPDPYYGSTNRGSVPIYPPDPLEGRAPGQVRLKASYGVEGLSPEDWREITATYFDMCHFVDDQVRDIVECAKRTGIYEDTIFVFWSDHGDFAGEHQLPEKWDTCFYDCLTHVPCILHAPGRLGAGRVGALVETVDILPTVLDLLGLSAPAGIDGRSALEWARGRDDEFREFVFCQGGQEAELFDRVAPPGGTVRPCAAYQMKQDALFRRPDINIRAKMLRDHCWKYIFHLSGFEELYDLAGDPAEIDNLAGAPSHETVLNGWRKKMIHKLVGSETRFPVPEFLES